VSAAKIGATIHENEAEVDAVLRKLAVINIAEQHWAEARQFRHELNDRRASSSLSFRYGYVLIALVGER
jgi:hypothetical protein